MNDFCVWFRWFLNTVYIEACFSVCKFGWMKSRAPKGFEKTTLMRQNRSRWRVSHENRKDTERKNHLQAEHPTANLKQKWNKQQKWTQGPEWPLISLIAPFLRGCAQGQFFPNRQCWTAENNQINQTKWRCSGCWCPQGTCSNKLSNKNDECPTWKKNLCSTRTRL